MNNIEYVVKNSDHVKIIKNNIPQIIEKIKPNDYSHWSQKDSFFKELNEKELILFSFLLESMNFCFWPNYNWKITYNNKEYFGSDTLLYTLINAIKNETIQLNIKELSKITRKDFDEFMKNNNEYPIMMDERYSSFKETIDIINKNDQFWNELTSIKSDLEMEKYITKQFPNFNDVSFYKGKEIFFHKRCRLVIGDIYFITKSFHKSIMNINKIMGCADYSLPRYFREIGILEYSKELENKIDQEKELNHNSNEEIEIRANTLYVLELIKKELKKKDIIISSIELDNIIWNISREKKLTKPHHTISIYY